MVKRAFLPQSPSRTDASPGLLTRRYSVPETIMRKYRLAQQSSEAAESCYSPARGSCASLSEGAAGCGGGRLPRRDRELMRRSALLRRMWGRAPPHTPHTPPAPVCCCSPPAPAVYAEHYSDQNYSEQKYTDRNYSDQNCSDQKYSEQNYTEKKYNEQIYSEHMYNDQNYNEQQYEMSEPTRYESLPLIKHQGVAPAYSVLEIVVSETLDSSVLDEPAPPPSAPSPAPVPRLDDLDIDEYVSNILVESLNSLTDQLESMNASIPSARRISIVEKEIKVKLHNTGVNTIVHLSPTSNHQIIFGNEELCDRERGRDSRRESLPPALTCRFAPPSPPPPPPCADVYDDIRHENVNKAVLQQIQKLFQEELQHQPPPPPECRVRVRAASPERELSGAFATSGNYSWEREPNALVPRASAYPHTDSMEVNTSSDSAGGGGGGDSSRASLVDSLEDPHSPRAALARAAAARAALVRSAIDVLELLPDTAPRPVHPASPSPASPPREPESFFVRMDDANMAETAVAGAVALPESLRQRLLRRHARRLQAARHRARAMRRGEDSRALRRLERDCLAVLNALLDDVIAKIAHDELQGARIRRRAPADSAAAMPRERRSWKRSAEPLEAVLSLRRSDGVRGRLTVPPAPPPRAPKRLYQKSEISECGRRVEILEILEYSESAHDASHSSPDTPSTDDNQNKVYSSARRSRIPVPVSMPALGGEAARPLKCRSHRAREPASPAPPPRRAFPDIPEEPSAPPAAPPAAPAMRSACTSPAPRARRHQTTMTDRTGIAA